MSDPRTLPRFELPPGSSGLHRHFWILEGILVLEGHPTNSTLPNYFWRVWMRVWGLEGHPTNSTLPNYADFTLRGGAPHAKSA